MKKLIVYLFAVVAISAAGCKGNSTGETGGAQADSGATNVGSSGPADSSAMVNPSGTAGQVGTSGTDTSSTGGGVATPTVDTPKNNQ